MISVQTRADYIKVLDDTLDVALAECDSVSLVELLEAKPKVHEWQEQLPGDETCATKNMCKLSNLSNLSNQCYQS